MFDRAAPRDQLRGAAPARLAFDDPYVKSAKVEAVAGLELRFPQLDAASAPDVLAAVRRRARDVFATLGAADIQASMRRLDAFFAAPPADSPAVRAIVDLVHRVDGFSRHDIERFGLGIFRPLVDYDPALIGRFVRRAFETRKPVETAFGHLRRFGLNSPFVRRRRPDLISHFASGNVAGYSAILTRMGLPLLTGSGSPEDDWSDGAAQVIKLPSTSAVFPMLYLSKMAEVAPFVRQTMACAYWRGGDRAVEDVLLAASDAVNILGSEAAVRDVESRASRLARRPIVLGHGHKVGAAYVSREFAASPDLRARLLDGLVRDISAFDGAACYCPKDIFVQGDHAAFAAELAEALGRHAGTASPVNPALKPVARNLAYAFEGASKVLAAAGDSAFVRIGDRPAFWLPDEVFRYVQVMPAEGLRQAAGILAQARHFLQTVVVAVPDAEIPEALDLLGEAGASNIHYPGSAPLLNVYEEPHDGDFDFVKVRYPYKVRFAATNFKRNADWLDK